MTLPATERQLAVLRLLVNGYSFREIVNALGYASTNAVADHVYRMERNGLVQPIRQRPWKLHNRYEATDAGLAALGLQRCPTCNRCGFVPRASSDDGSPEKNPPGRSQGGTRRAA